MTAASGNGKYGNASGFEGTLRRLRAGHELAAGGFSGGAGSQSIPKTDGPYPITVDGAIGLVLTYIPEAGSLHVYCNGVCQEAPADYTVSGKTVSVAAAEAIAGDVYWVHYTYMQDEQDLAVTSGVYLPANTLPDGEPPHFVPAGACGNPVPGDDGSDQWFFEFAADPAYTLYGVAEAGPGDTFTVHAQWLDPGDNQLKPIPLGGGMAVIAYDSSTGCYVTVTSLLSGGGFPGQFSTLTDTLSATQTLAFVRVDAPKVYVRTQGGNDVYKFPIVAHAGSIW